MRTVARWFGWGSIAALIMVGVMERVQGEEVAAEGITEPILDVTLGAPVAGIVASREVEEGQFVESGAVLLELDKTLEELEARRRELVLGPLKSDLDGTRHLYETTQSVRKEDLNKKELEYNVAVIDHQVAKEQMQKRTITAPFEGYVTEILLEVGEATQAQQPLLRLVDTRQCYFVSNVEARAGHGLQVGQGVQLEILTGAAPVTVPGRVVFVSPVVDPASGLMRVKAVFENPNGEIRPGVAGVMRFDVEAANVN